MTATKIQHSAADAEPADTENVGVSDRDRTGDNWSHKPVSHTGPDVFPEENGGVGGAGDAPSGAAPSTFSPPAWALALAAESVGLGRCG